MDKESRKKAAAEAALQYIDDDMVVGVGTGSTASYFIDALASMKHRIEGTVASSKETEQKLKAHGIRVFDLNTVDNVPVYVDGADEINKYLHMVKGGGGALTREKIIAAVARKFICIADDSKQVDVMGNFPIPVEVIPMARSYVARQIVVMGGDPIYRDGFVTDNGNIIIDIHNLKIMEPLKLEQNLNNIVGVVTNGLFANRPADLLLLGTGDEVRTFKAK